MTTDFYAGIVTAYMSVALSMWFFISTLGAPAVLEVMKAVLQLIAAREEDDE